MASRGPRPFKAPKKKGVKRNTLTQRLKKVTLGDLGEVIGGAWEGAKALLPFNSEIKRYDTAATTTAPAAGVVLPLFAPALGTDYNQRIGQSVRVESLEVRFFGTIAAGMGTALLRVVIFIDTDCQGVLPAVNGGASGLLENAAPASNLNHLSLERHEIIHDEMADLEAVDRLTFHRHIRIPLGHHVRFLSNAGTVADLGQGSLFMMLMDAAGATSFGWQARTSYVDN